MMRAIRFAGKLGLTISEECAEPIRRLAPLLQDIPAARHFDEIIKLLLSGQGLVTYRLLKEYKLLQMLFPILFKEGEDDKANSMIEQALIDSDARIASGKRVTPAYIYAIILWYPLEQRAQEMSFESGMEYHDAFVLAINEVLSIQVKTIAIPKRFSATIRDIWMLQLRLPRFGGKRAERLYQHIKFRAAFDFLSLRARVEQSQELAELTAWWQEYQKHNKLPEHSYNKKITNKAAEIKPAYKKTYNKRKYANPKNKTTVTQTDD
jgi:poly(A) polymerase